MTKQKVKCIHYTWQMNAMEIIWVLKPTTGGKKRQSSISPDGFRDNLFQAAMAFQDEQRGVSGCKH